MTLVFLSLLLSLAILVQFFIAGMAAMTNPDWWNYHKIWVSIFQWMVLPLPVVAWLCGSPRSLRMSVAAMPLVQIALQYVFVHRALDGRWPFGVGLHAVNAALMLVVALTLAGLSISKRDHVI